MGDHIGWTGELPVTSGGIIRITVELRERYLDPQTERALVQPCGGILAIWIWSDRSNIRLELPFDGFRVGPPQERSLGKWGVNVNRWLSSGNQRGNSGRWPDQATLDVDTSDRSGKTTIQASVTSLNAESPW